MKKMMKKTASVKRNELLEFIGDEYNSVENVVLSSRIHFLNGNPAETGSVFYIMTREYRVKDNWALIHSSDIANKHAKPLNIILFIDEHISKNFRRIDFILRGLDEIEKNLFEKNIGFKVVVDSKNKFLSYLKNIKPGYLVTDFSPLEENLEFNKKIAASLNCTCVEVDAHNIVPCRFVSAKQEYSAATLRAKIKTHIRDYLKEFPLIKPQKNKDPNYFVPNKKYLRNDFYSESSSIKWIDPGESQAKKLLDRFIDNSLEFYFEFRNDPLKSVISDLSPFLHFGYISSQRIAISVLRSDASISDKEAFLEELIVRKELSDNFCLYNKNYKNVKAFPNWATSTLIAHSRDVRTYCYSLTEFENAKTHDPLWNAIQMELLLKGKPHSYLRMYWGKKILEWSESFEQALNIANYLNDKYAIDGEDPNGYVGIAWCIGGVHDRAWSERSVFGKIRYMNYSGCKKKFDVNSYISQYIVGK